MMSNARTMSMCAELQHSSLRAFCELRDPEIRMVWLSAVGIRKGISNLVVEYVLNTFLNEMLRMHLTCF